MAHCVPTVTCLVSKSTYLSWGTQKWPQISHYNPTKRKSKPLKSLELVNLAHLFLKRHVGYLKACSQAQKINGGLICVF